jgi:TRAP-type C4-dicarboxylate transport system permease small subunit
LERAVIAGITYLLIGALLSWVGWRHWRYRKEETVSALEVGILKVTGQEPLPRTRLDRFLTYLQATFGFVLGPFFFVLGIIVILAKLELL